MKIHTFIAVSSLGFVSMSFAEDSAPDPSKAPKIEVGAQISLSGKLEGKVMAIGGETTGWRLQYSSGGKKATIEVDMKGIKDAEKLEGKEVAVSGKIVAKQYVERGKVLILAAVKIEPKP